MKTICALDELMPHEFADCAKENEDIVLSLNELGSKNQIFLLFSFYFSLNSCLNRIKIILKITKNDWKIPIQVH